MPLNKGNTKTADSDSQYQKMTNKPRKGPQKSGEDIYAAEDWIDDPELESGKEQKDKFEKQRMYDQMMKNRKKKLGLGKWGRKAKK